MHLYQTFVRPAGRSGEHGASLMEAAGGPMARAATRRLGLPPDGDVLEIGFGPGLALAEFVGLVPRGRVTGLDPSALMHRYASVRNAAAIADARLVLVEGEAGSLPFADDRFDGVLSTDNAHFWPDLSAGLGEVRRVLRPGASVVVAFTPPSGGPPPAFTAHLKGAGFVGVERHLTEAGTFYRALKPTP